ICAGHGLLTVVVGGAISGGRDGTAAKGRSMRLFVADGHGLTRAGVRWAVERDDGFEVVGEAKTGAQVLARIPQSAPDVVLLDTSLSGMDVLTCLTRIRGSHSGVRVIVLTDEASQFIATVCAHGA